MRKKIEVARWTRELDLPLDGQCGDARQNLHQLSDIIQMAVDLDADRWRSRTFNITAGR